MQRYRDNQYLQSYMYKGRAKSFEPNYYFVGDVLTMLKIHRNALGFNCWRENNFHSNISRIRPWTMPSKILFIDMRLTIRTHWRHVYTVSFPNFIVWNGFYFWSYRKYSWHDKIMTFSVPSGKVYWSIGIELKLPLMFQMKVLNTFPSYTGS